MIELDLAPQTEVSVKMRQGLASAYGNQGFMDYLKLGIQSSSQNLITALDRGQVDEARRLANRIEYAQKLISICQQYYKNIEKLNKNNDKK